MRWTRFFLICALAAVGVSADTNDLSQWENGSDLESFVSRPDIKAPRIVVAKHYPDRISDGYWFVAPYSNLADQTVSPRKEFTPCQSGAHIYDGDGNLVWSGACWGGNRNAFAFRPFVVNGNYYLSAYLPGQVLGDRIADADREGHGYILNNRYEEIKRITVHNGRPDIHEFKLADDGKSAILTTYNFTKRDVSGTVRHIFNTGFEEVDVADGETKFAWDPLEHGISPAETFNTKELDNPSAAHIDFIHINAVEKNLEGDYLVSGRHTSAIYKISGKDGHVIWRLGGKKSDFVMDEGLDFKWQHDVRFLFQNATHTIVSLFDNSAEEGDRNRAIPPMTSSAKIISLDTSSKPMTARLVRKIHRPDGKSSAESGSMQMVEDDWQNGNAFVNWAAGGYISEHDGAGRLVMEARYMSPRMSTYRAFKSRYVGEPSTPPTLKMLPIKSARDKWITAFYTSWNGATEVASYEFWGSAISTGDFSKIGSAIKTGFETSWVAPTLVQFGYIEAIDVKGNVIGRSEMQAIGPQFDGPYRTYSTLLASTRFAGRGEQLKFLMPASTGSDSPSWAWTLVFDALAVIGFWNVARKFHGMRRI